MALRELQACCDGLEMRANGLGIRSASRIGFMNAELGSHGSFELNAQKIIRIGSRVQVNHGS